MADIENAHENPIIEVFDLKRWRTRDFEVFIFPKGYYGKFHLFTHDKSFSVYRDLNQIIMEMDSKNEELIFAIPGGENLPLYRTSRLTFHPQWFVGPYDFACKLSRAERLMKGILAIDLAGNVFLTNSDEFNSKHVKSAMRLGNVILDNFEVVCNDSFTRNFAIGMTSDGELLVAKTDHYKSHSEWVKLFVNCKCCNAAFIESPDSDCFIRGENLHFDVRTYGGFIACSLSKNKIQSIRVNEIGIAGVNEIIGSRWMFPPVF